ncbi:ATP-binding protein [Pontibacter sp. G13]|uniref:ATP-binding protein n=1 Tax=Pontibacter sp. G13 TaxID=3074898 RepID=UPI00288B5420|nr:ATP-binding protein [Pontibacter sp. G13]WNJ17614.1 ATP-binding protein [Pontibacter sp. G13]
MEFLTRSIWGQVNRFFTPGKVLLLLGPRRVGKTVLMRKFMQRMDEPYLYLSGEDMRTTELLARRTVAAYQTLMGNHKALFIDEAQKIPEIGLKLKLMIDHIPDLRIIATGSSAFDLVHQAGEPLTGRSWMVRLFPFSSEEYAPIENVVTRQEGLRHRMVYGCYPELIQYPDLEMKSEYLRELVNTYLLKDILELEGLRNSHQISKLLKLLAFQTGALVSNRELGSQLGMDNKTIDKYLDLLSKVFIIFPVGGFNRNLRKEISKSRKWYFTDNGIKNILIDDMRPLDQRNDAGALWENYAISERVKFLHNHRIAGSHYFWRTYDQQEIDWIESRNGQLHAYQFKWNPQKSGKRPKAWAKNYPDSTFETIHPENIWDWITETS